MPERESLPAGVGRKGQGRRHGEKGRVEVAVQGTHTVPLSRGAKRLPRVRRL